MSAKGVCCRDQFEALAGDFLQRSAQPLAELLARNKVAVADLTGVELLGGGSRVPAVKAALSAALNGRQLDTWAPLNSSHMLIR